MFFHKVRVRCAAKIAGFSGAAALFLGLGSSAIAQEIVGQSKPLSASARANFSAQFRAFQSEKSRLTPSQRKLSSRLVWALPAKKARLTRNFASFRGYGTTQSDSRTDVIISGRVTPALLSAIAQAGGEVVSVAPGAVRALLSPLGAEKVAGLAEVTFIRPYIAPRTRAGAVVSEGDVAHGAAPTRELFKIAGQGIKIGVISDGVATLSRSQKSGELPANVTIIKNAAGQSQKGSGDEGTAMLEIVHDIAPGAQLLFATGNGGQETFADNIRRLRAAGCRIIVDDLIYLDEGVYQDDIVARAVNDVVADGALYFSAAGNDGNMSAGTSTTWDGQFRAGELLSTEKGLVRAHSWGASPTNIVMGGGSGYAILQWADPLGASTNDYDLYVLDSDGNIVDSSQVVQDGTNNALEYAFVTPESQIVVTLSAGVARPLRLMVLSGGRLAQATSGSVYGHSAAESCIGVAAVFAPGLRGDEPFTRANRTESFSSDGPRTFYFDPNGNKKTFTVKTPQIAAADGVKTSVDGFTTFFGTSAAAPHAAAIAALVWSFKPNQTAEQVKAELYKSTLDIMKSGFDNDSGRGILMADRVLARIGPPVVSIAPAITTVREGDSTNRSFKVTVSLSKSSTSVVRLKYATINGTAGAGSDFVAKSGTLSIPA
ncbi:MAG TPA: S8 family serine peptidase, partial [Abditibacterium sp.]